MAVLRFCWEVVKLVVAILTLTGTLLVYLVTFLDCLVTLAMGLIIFIVFALLLALAGHVMWGGPFWAWATGCILLGVVFALGAVNVTSGPGDPGENQ